MKYTESPGPFRAGKLFGTIVCDTPVPEIHGSEEVSYYGGHLVAESVSTANRRRIIAALNACAGTPTEWLELQYSGEGVELFGEPRPLYLRIQAALEHAVRLRNEQAVMADIMGELLDVVLTLEPEDVEEGQRLAALKGKTRAILSAVRSRP